MKKIEYFFSILRQIFSISFSTMLVYRGNVIFFLIFETLFLISNFVVAGVGVDLAGGSILGWDKSDIYLLTAFNNVTHQFFVCFMIGPIFSLSYDTANGRMDYVLLKPLSPLAAIFATHEFTISNIPSFILSIGMFIYFSLQTSWDFSLGTFSLFFLAGFLALIARAALALVTVSTCFFAEKLTDGENGFWNLVSLTKVPTAVFPKIFQMIFSTILPLAIVSSVPIEVLVHKPLFIPVGLTMLCTIVFFAFSLFFFNFCLRFYKSTNAGL